MIGLLQIISSFVAASRFSNGVLEAAASIRIFSDAGTHTVISLLTESGLIFDLFLSFGLPNLKSDKLIQTVLDHLF